MRHLVKKKSCVKLWMFPRRLTNYACLIVSGSSLRKYLSCIYKQLQMLRALPNKTGGLVRRWETLIWNSLKKQEVMRLQIHGIYVVYREEIYKDFILQKTFVVCCCHLYCDITSCIRLVINHCNNSQ